MTSTLPGSRATRRARRDMTWRRRTRWKSSWASAEGKPVSSGGATSFSKVLAPARAHHTVLVGNTLAPANEARTQARRDASGIGIARDACTWGAAVAGRLGPRREGAEVKRAGIRVQRRDRRGLDGAGLQPGRVAGLRRRRGGHRPAG